MKVMYLIFFNDFQKNLIQFGKFWLFNHRKKNEVLRFLDIVTENIVWHTIINL